jgi:hypothetical protein
VSIEHHQRARAVAKARALFQEKTNMRPSSRRLSKLVGLFVLAACVALPSLALAQSTQNTNAPKDQKASYAESRDDSGQVVKFTDDPLDGTGLGGGPGVINGGHQPSRSNLMRPRYNFVSELRKSIEHM